jgi:hypothetical protein
VNYLEEGEIENQVTLSNDGKIYLDGNEVTFSVEIEKDNNNNSLEAYKDSVVVRSGGSDQWQTTSCPYGKERDYSDYQFTERVGNIKLNECLELISDTILRTILLGVGASLASGGTAWAFVSTFVVYDVIQTIRACGEILGNENTKYLSFKAKVYYHTKGHVVGNLLAVQKEKQYWYTQADFEGDYENIIVYSCRQYY